MIYRTFLVLVLIGAGLTLNCQEIPDWENPSVFERNQVRPHASLMPYATLDEALEGKRKTSPYHLTLNGTWDFHWAANLEDAPEGFYENGYQRGDWHRIKVPSNWQMEGFGYPLFRNIGLPHPLDPPKVPVEFNPVGSYYRTFDLPNSWDGRQIFLHFEGVHSAFYLWVNGEKVGYNQGGMEPAEFDITSFVRTGENSVAVKVFRYSDGSYLEDQDTWRLSGIYRDVYLMATPEVHIRDFFVTTDLDEDYRNARLKVQTEISNYGRKKAKGISVKPALYDLQGEKLTEVNGEIALASLTAGASAWAEGAYDITRPKLWSAEFPHLYTLVLELLDEEGRNLEYLSTRVGFREVEVKDQALFVNGRAIKFNGVNSHMMHPESGHAMDTGTMRKDLILMKQFNINCVRTSHYPPNVEYLEMADELGMYIVDETGDEAHAYIELSYDEEWKAQYLDRMRKMVYRDRNHPSVVIWSAGNESGPGDNICSLMEEGKRIDPSRPAWMYGGNSDRNPRTNPIRCEDIVGPRYLQPFRLEQRFALSDDPRPSFMDEYIAATGNSLGGLDEYWDLIYRYPRLTGGAIWDWISPGITMPVRLTKDDSPLNVQAALINQANLEEGPYGQAIFLSGNDDWVELYRHPGLDITGHALSLSMNVKPGPFNGNGHFLTKGDYQFGIVQSDSSHLEFYLNTGMLSSLKVKLPEDWTGSWHHVAGIYDGKKMELYLDGKLMGTKACFGGIINSPYPVYIGKSSELRDSHRGYTCFATIDRVRIFDRVVSIEELTSDSKTELLTHSKLWLDFETLEDAGKYWSIGIPGRTYGLVWPDRSIQPELWQLKKTPQPIKTEALEESKKAFRVINRHHFRNLSDFEMQWELSQNGIPTTSGYLDIKAGPGDSIKIEIPWVLPDDPPKAEYHLTVRYLMREDQPWARAGHVVAWDQFEIPVTRLRAEKNPEVKPSGELIFEDHGNTCSFTGKDFLYVFSKKSGSLISLVYKDKEFLDKGPGLNVWRAPLANELDSWNGWHTEMGYTLDWMGKETANGWRSLGLDRLEQSVIGFRADIKEGKGYIRVESNLHANNHTTGYRVIYSYSIDPSGSLELTTSFSPRGYQPRWLPKIGIQMSLLSEFRNLGWFGRGPYENYPDRKTGTAVGYYNSTVEEEYIPYIIPQDYGNKCDVRHMEIMDDKGIGLRIVGEKLFNFSVHKYSTDQLDRASHRFQLQEEDRVTVNLDHRVSGVGCTAISVLNPYRIKPVDTEFTFRIIPFVIADE